jgi:hypothetical protein
VSAGGLSTTAQRELRCMSRHDDRLWRLVYAQGRQDARQPRRRWSLGPAVGARNGDRSGGGSRLAVPVLDLRWTRSGRMDSGGLVVAGAGPAAALAGQTVAIRWPILSCTSGPVPVACCSNGLAEGERCDLSVVI